MQYLCKISELAGVFKEIAYKANFGLFEPQDCDSFIFICAAFSIGAFVGPMHGRLVCLGDGQVHLKSELRVLPEENAKESEDTLFSDEGLGLGKIKSDPFRE